MDLVFVELFPIYTFTPMGILIPIPKERRKKVCNFKPVLLCPDAKEEPDNKNWLDEKMQLLLNFVHRRTDQVCSHALPDATFN